MTWYVGWLFELTKIVAQKFVPGSKDYKDLIKCTGSKGLTGLNMLVSLAGANSLSELMQQLTEKGWLSALSQISYVACSAKDCVKDLPIVEKYALLFDSICNFGTFTAKQLRCTTAGFSCESNAWGRRTPPTCGGLEAAMKAKNIPLDRRSCQDCCGAQANHLLGCRHTQDTIKGRSGSRCYIKYRECLKACEDLSQGACLPQCSDRVDNDGDGFTDKDDYACRLNGPSHNDESSPKAQCENGIDDDNDGKTDRDDPGCIHPNSGQYHPYLDKEGVDVSKLQCSDGVDNDSDGFTDGSDFACSSTDGNHNDESSPKAQCEDSLDNDGDGKVDSKDNGCIHPNSGTYHPYLNNEGADVSKPQCSDGLDNDRDGFTDGSDFACSSTDGNHNDESSPKAQCEDSRDNDGDGKVDSKDNGCIHPNSGTYHPYLNNEGADVSKPQCSDGVDNDADSYIDGADSACRRKGPLHNDERFPLAECEDGIDNDGDGKVDRSDRECIDPSSGKYDRRLDSELLQIRSR
jgi:hypothetical protein